MNLAVLHSINETISMTHLENLYFFIHPYAGVSDDKTASPKHVCTLSLVLTTMQEIKEGELRVPANSSAITMCASSI